MSDYEELLARLLTGNGCCKSCTDFKLLYTAAAAIEALVRDEYELRLIIMGGEDAPGHASSIPLDDLRDMMARERREMQERAEKAEAILALQGVGIGAIESEQAAARELARQLINAERERDEARAALEKIANGPRDVEKTYAELFAEVVGEARAALPNGGRDE